jgi:succinate dehydrogenase/fumarate reductase flavoprotein subunit
MLQTNAGASPPEEVDVLVTGAGAAGMTAALVAAAEGCEVLLCEKSSQVGGTGARSSGCVWYRGMPRTTRRTRPVRCGCTWTG